MDKGKDDNYDEQERKKKTNDQLCEVQTERKEKKGKGDEAGKR